MLLCQPGAETYVMRSGWQATRSTTTARPAATWTPAVAGACRVAARPTRSRCSCPLASSSPAPSAATARRPGALPLQNLLHREPCFG